MGTTDPLLAATLAQHLGVQLWSPDQIPGLAPQHLHTLLVTDKDNWSAVTVEYASSEVVIFNPTHSAGRNSRDVMHELSHLLLGHAPSTVFMSPDTGVSMRSFDRKAEEEAAWLGGRLLIPRPAALSIVGSKTDQDTACEMYVVTADLLRMRIQVSGVATQMRRRAASLPGVRP